MTVTNTGPIASVSTARSESGSEVLIFQNAFWALEVDLEPSINPRYLKHLETGQVLADEDYCYHIELASARHRKTGYHGGEECARGLHLIDWRVDEDKERGASTLTLTGRVDFGRDGPTDLVVEHSFTILADKDRFEERIALQHRYGHDEHEIADYRFGFRKRMFDARKAAWIDHLDEYKLSAIPFRRRRGHAKDYLKQDYSAADLMPANWIGNNLPNRQSEAWSWQNGDTGFCFSKYNQDLIEFALVDGEFHTPRAAQEMDGMTSLAAVGDVVLRFLGAGRTHGAPGTPVIVNAQTREFEFGVSTIIPFRGSWEEGHRVYGAFLRERGHVVPKGFNPPVHWNELYNLGWRGMNTPLQELPELWEEAERAKAMGAEAFYFDPVWDLFEGSSVWDEARLGPLPDFVSKLKQDYGLSLSLHLMMHTKSAEEDPAIYRRGPDGEILEWNDGKYNGGYVCCASPAWQDQKSAKLLALAEAGVTFFMFDFNEYSIPSVNPGVVRLGGCEPCYSPDHGHSVPATLEEHAAGLYEVMKRVKDAYPDMLIEAHDAVTAGWQDYLPLYFGHGAERPAFDEHWGFEYMWNPYLDLLSGKSLSLYEYNLAFDIPLYLHINLRFDNDNALAFWWYASTCRHLGIGGLKPGDAIWDSHVDAMQTYRRLKPHFAQGRFLGFDPMVHGHVLDEQRSAAFVAFNMSSRPVEFARTFSLEGSGLPAGARFEGEGVSVAETELTLKASMPALSAHVFEVSWE
ncbi:alpha-amylase family protein [Cucumibacter marinus]|uniref:hypothetical protein n=1 Tax=Cucumibacter marinus TaxID=1121252 RepID=UPI00048C5BC6|nr:hypothetical protein [Cucumibacter marinus]